MLERRLGRSRPRGSRDARNGEATGAWVAHGGRGPCKAAVVASYRGQHHTCSALPATLVSLRLCQALWTPVVPCPPAGHNGGGLGRGRAWALLCRLGWAAHQGQALLRGLRQVNKKRGKRSRVVCRWLICACCAVLPSAGSEARESCGSDLCPSPVAASTASTAS